MEIENRSYKERNTRRFWVSSVSCQLLTGTHYQPVGIRKVSRIDGGGIQVVGVCMRSQKLVCRFNNWSITESKETTSARTMNPGLYKLKMADHDGTSFSY